MFFGRYDYTIDTKGRLNFPAKFRDAMGESFVVLEWVDSCLFALPMEEVERLADKLESDELTEAALARNGILDYFEQIYTCTETGAGKDEPLIYLKAAESMQAEPNETLVFEDALHAAETAKKAGFVVIGVYDEENRKNISKMKEVCDCYCDRMDTAIENIRLTI